MKRICNIDDIPAECRGTTAVIGNFDGVHLGHQSVIGLARDLARKLDSPLGVITFEPHPRSFFAPGSEPFRLMNSDARSMKLESLGVDVLFELPFDRDLALMTAGAFASDVLHDGLGAAHVVVGNDFRYGVRRAGTAATLVEDGKSLGLAVTIAPDEHISGSKISSTAIRDALSRGDTGAAATLLGGNHSIVGHVITGERRGRTLGFPTANISLDGLLLPAAGVYAVTVDIDPSSGRDPLPGVASIGVKPTFGTHAPGLEVYIFDFTDDIYGRLVSVELAGYLRPEIRYDNVDDLVSQMRLDCDDARALLARTPST